MVRFSDLMGGEEEPEEGLPATPRADERAPGPGEPGGASGREVAADDDAAAAAAAEEALARLAGIAAEAARSDDDEASLPPDTGAPSPLTTSQAPEEVLVPAVSEVPAVPAAPAAPEVPAEAEEPEEVAEAAPTLLSDDLLPRRKRRR